MEREVCSSARASKAQRSRIINKVEGPNKILKEIKEDVSTLSKMSTSHSIYFKQLEIQMGKISSNLNPRQERGLPSDTMADPTKFKWDLKSCHTIK